MKLYIENWYLCYDLDICEQIIKDWHIVWLWKPIWFKQIRYKVNKDWLFEEVKEEN